MQGLPKFLLPFSPQELLIDKHIKGGLESGCEYVVVIVRSRFFDLVSEYLSKYEDKVKIVKLNIETKTMSETLILGLEDFEFEDNDRLIVGLSDTALSIDSYAPLYKQIVNSTAPLILSLFQAQPEQLGKLGQVLVDDQHNVLDVRDKDLNCRYPLFWGIASFNYSYMKKIENSDAHIGISFERWVREKHLVSGLISDLSYFDCGTFPEYKRFLASR